MFAPAAVPSKPAGGRRDANLDRLSNILNGLNDQCGTLFTDADRVARRILEDIAPKVAADPAYRNAKQNSPSSARFEHDKALSKVMLTLLKDDTQVYKLGHNSKAVHRAYARKARMELPSLEEYEAAKGGPAVNERPIVFGPPGPLVEFVAS